MIGSKEDLLEALLSVHGKVIEMSDCLFSFCPPIFSRSAVVGDDVVVNVRQPSGSFTPFICGNLTCTIAEFAVVYPGCEPPAKVERRVRKFFFR